MKTKRLMLIGSLICSMGLLGGCASSYKMDCQSFCNGNPDCGPYSCTTNADTSPSICNGETCGGCDSTCSSYYRKYSCYSDNCVDP